MNKYFNDAIVGNGNISSSFTKKGELIRLNYPTVDFRQYIDFFNVGINLSSSVNIMGQKYKIDNAKVQVEIAENEIDLTKQDIYFQVQNLYVNMIQYEKQIPLLAVKVKQTLENFELADGRYAVGLGDYIELQDAKVNYNNAQINYVQAVHNYNVARTNLEKAIALPQSVTAPIEDKKNARKSKKS